MGFLDKLRGKSSNDKAPPDFSNFDDGLGDDPFKDTTGLDSQLGTNNQTNRQDIINTQTMARQQMNSNEPIIRTEPSPMKLPGSSQYQENKSSFDHNLFNNQQDNNQQINDQVVYQEISSRQADLILERLDTVKAELDSIKQRLKHIELLVDKRDLLNTQKRYL